MEVDMEIFIMAEIPGLIEGASQGKGLGHEFLRHSTRTRVFIHLIDGNTESISDSYVKVNNELYLYDPDLMKNPQIVAINKIDVEELKQRIPDIKKDFDNIGVPVHFISAATGEGVKELMRDAYVLLNQKTETKEPEPEKLKVFRPSAGKERVRMNQKGTVFIISAPEIERVVARVDVSDERILPQLRALLNKKGITRELEKIGIKPGSIVRCGQSEWEW